MAMIRTLIAVAALQAAGGWHYETTLDPLGQTVHVAAVAPEAGRPYVGMRLMCGGLPGIVLQVNLGDMRYASMVGAPARSLTFETANAPAHEAAAARAPIADGVGTYEIKGSEARNVAHLLTRGNQVTVRQGSQSATFPLTGAALAIGEVIANCPFKL
jgi:hypothetical protein